MPKPDLNKAAVIEEFSEVGKTQADGVRTIDTRITTRRVNDQTLSKWQIQIELPDSALPATGSMVVSVRSPGAALFQDVVGTIDLTQEAALLYRFEAMADEIKLAPTNLEAGLLYNAYLSASE